MIEIARILDAICLLPDDSVRRTTTHFEYSDLGYPVLRDVAGSGVETTEFNAFGEPWRVTTASGSTTMVRDTVGRTLYRLDSDGQSAKFEWEGAPECDVPTGSLCRTTSSDGATRDYSYDELARLDGIATNIDTTTLRSHYRYDAFGRISQIGRDGAPTIQNEYDDVGRFESVSVVDGPELWRANAHHATGPVSSAQFGNGAAFDRTIEEGLFRNSSLSAPNMTPVFPGAGTSSITVDSLEVTYDAAGRIDTREVPHLGLHEVFEYEGDQLYMGTMSRNGVDLGTWEQDYWPTGAVERHSDIGTFEYADPAHPLGATQAGAIGYSYGAQGRQVSRGGHDFSWNVRGRLRTVTGDADISYAYDAQDVRVRKLETSPTGTATTYYGVGEELEVTEEKMRTIYVSGPEGPVAALRSSDNYSSTEILYLHQNEQGSSTLVTNAAGEVVERQDFDAFGRRRPVLWGQDESLPSLPSELDVGFTGHRREEEYGLVDMGGRHYDPHLARFASPDPFTGDPLRAVGYDPFAYVLNRPLRFTDPTGYQADQRVNFTTSDIEASLDSHVVFGDPVTGSTGFGSATVEYNYGLLGGAEDTIDADLQLELDAVSVENAVGLEEFAQQYMPEPPPLNPDRISLPRVPLPEVPTLVRLAYPGLGDLTGNGAIAFAEELLNVPTEVSLGYDEMSDGKARIERGDALNGADKVAYGAGRWGHATLAVLAAGSAVKAGIAAKRGGDVVTLYKAPTPGRKTAANEVAEGFDAAQYPGMGPFFSTEKGVAQRYRFHYQNGLQEFHILRAEYEALLRQGAIRVDALERASVHAPASFLDSFNRALKMGPSNRYIAD